MCLAATSGVVVAADKHFFVRWESWYMIEIVAFAVICRVYVMLVYLSGAENLTYNGRRYSFVAVCVAA